MIDLFIRMTFAHIFTDFFLQPKWMAEKKHIPLSFASLLHGFLHFVTMLFFVPWTYAICIAMIHILVDLYVIQIAWFQLVRPDLLPPNEQKLPGIAACVFIVIDQFMHILPLYLVAGRVA